MPVLTAALFSIARTWKQLKCPSTEEQIENMWHIYIMEYDSAMKMNEIGSFIEMQVDLESVKHSEISQKEKNNCCILIHVCRI